MGIFQLEKPSCQRPAEEHHPKHGDEAELKSRAIQVERVECEREDRRERQKLDRIDPPACTDGNANGGAQQGRSHRLGSGQREKSEQRDCDRNDPDALARSQTNQYTEKIESAGKDGDAEAVAGQEMRVTGLSERFLDVDEFLAAIAEHQGGKEFAVAGGGGGEAGVERRAAALPEQGNGRPAALVEHLHAAAMRDRKFGKQSLRAPIPRRVELPRIACR